MKVLWNWLLELCDLDNQPTPQQGAEALTRLGTSMMDRRSHEAAEFYERALSLFGAVNDRCGQARCYINLGIIHQRQGEPAAAEAAYDRALEAARSAHAVDHARDVARAQLRRCDRDLELRRAVRAERREIGIGWHEAAAEHGA